MSKLGVSDTFPIGSVLGFGPGDPQSSCFGGWDGLSIGRSLQRLHGSVFTGFELVSSAPQRRYLKNLSQVAFRAPFAQSPNVGISKTSEIFAYVCFNTEACQLPYKESRNDRSRPRPQDHPNRAATAWLRAFRAFRAFRAQD